MDRRSRFSFAKTDERLIIALALENHCRVILSGDTRQHHGVERGDALRILERSGLMEQAALNKDFPPADRGACGKR